MLSTGNGELGFIGWCVILLEFGLEMLLEVFNGI